MHDEPQIFHWYDKKFDKIKMVPGLVFTIEPILCENSNKCKIDDDGWTARTTDGECQPNGNIQLVLQKTGL